MLQSFIAWLLRVVQSIVEMFPVADTSGLREFFAPAGRLIAWVQALNGAFPIAEVGVAVGLILGVYGAMYTVLTVRRLFSLIWPGAGS